MLSALAFSTAGLFTKGVAAPAWDVIFWRGLFSTAFLTVFIALRRRMRPEFGRMGRPGWAVAQVLAVGTAAFIPAFKLSTVANVALIYAAAPLLTAALAWAWFRERMSRRIATGCAGAAVGVAVIVGGSLEGIALRGDLLALVMTCAVALVMVIYRRFPDTPGAGPVVLSSLLLVPIAFLLGDPGAVAPREVGVLAGFGLVFAVSQVALAEGREAPAARRDGALEQPRGGARARARLDRAVGGAAVADGPWRRHRPPRGCSRPRSGSANAPRGRALRPGDAHPSPTPRATARPIAAISAAPRTVQRSGSVPNTTKLSAVAETISR